MAQQYVLDGYYVDGYTIDDVLVDWGTKVIFVPKNFLTLVQSDPIEIFQLSINDFRLKLRELEATLEGMPHLRTHEHNTEVNLGGIVYARVVEIVNGYTVTFEDGQYAVNLVGANSNIGDVINLNQVSVRSANSAGLISNQAIEYSSFNGYVTIDAVNGVVGTTFPRGTPQLPVNNIQDAILIAEFRGFNRLFFKGNFTFTSGDDISTYYLEGESPLDTTLTFESGAIVDDVKVFTSTVQGTFDNLANFDNCRILDVSFVRGTFNTCQLIGDIRLAGGAGQTNLIDCKDGLASDTGFPVIDFSGSTNSLIVRNYDGDLAIHNKTGPEPIEINMSTGGRIWLQPTVTDGFIRVTGIAEITDESNGDAVVDTSQLIFPDFTQLSAFEGNVSIDIANGVAGTRFPKGTKQLPVNNIQDALTIAQSRLLTDFEVIGVLPLVNVDISGYKFHGSNNLTSTVACVSGVTTTNTTFTNMVVTGTLSGHTYMEYCGLQSLHNIGDDIFPSIFKECIIRADVDVSTPALSLCNVGNNQNTHFIDCVSGVPGEGTATLDINNCDSPIAFRRYGGGIKLINCTNNQDMTFEFNQGQIKLDPSCTTGKIRLGGIYKLTDDSTLLVEERNQSITDSISFSGGTFTGDTAQIAAAVWDKLVGDHQDNGSFGKLLSDLIDKANDIQHTNNLNTDLLINKPNNPNPDP